MKKLVTLAVIAMFAFNASAQFYMGGSLNLGSSTMKPEAEDAKKTTTTSLGIAPEFGYSLNEKSDIGIAIGFSNSTNKVGDDKSKSNAFQVAPYYRYTFLNFGNFGVAAQAALSFASGEDETSQVGNGKYTQFGLFAAPVLKYTLSEKFTLLSNLNFASVGFSQTKYKEAYKTTDFGIGVDTYNVQTLGDITIGFVYHF